MDCDTTGIEPDLALDEGEEARRWRHDVDRQPDDPACAAQARLLRRADRRRSSSTSTSTSRSIGAPGFKPEHLPVFACSMGDNTIHYMGHVKMMGAVQPFISRRDLEVRRRATTLLSTADGLVRIGSCTAVRRRTAFRDEIIEVASLEGDRRRPTRSTTAVTDPCAGGAALGPPGDARRTTTGCSWRREGGFDWVRDLARSSRGDWSRCSTATTCGRRCRHVSTTSCRRAPYGSRRRFGLPVEMTEELAFLLGAYASEGHTTRSTWTITITNSVDSVLERVADSMAVAVRSRGRGSCTRPIGARTSPWRRRRSSSSSSTSASGRRASDKRIPDAVLRSPREMVLAFLQGLCARRVRRPRRRRRSGRSASTHRACSTTSRPC